MKILDFKVVEVKSKGELSCPCAGHKALGTSGVTTPLVSNFQTKLGEW